MPLDPALVAALRGLGASVQEDAPLDRVTWWRCGGPADAVVTIEDPAALAGAVRLASEAGAPTFVLGNGSNILVSDSGIRGLVLNLRGALADVEEREGLLEAGAGLRLTVLLARAERRGWAGLECLAGIPGTVGGAVRMNAGTALGEIADILVDVDVVLPDGSLERLPRAALGMAYRTTVLPPGAVVARARLRPGAGPLSDSLAAIRHHLDRRKATQPLDKPSCGSTFRNPPGDHAGRLIEAAGLKGFTIGAAQISEKHANFVLNLGGARADDIRRVIEHARDTVRERFGVELVPEVHLVGDWER